MNKILRLLGVTHSRTISADIHIDVGKVVTVTLVQYANWSEEEERILDDKKETRMFNLVPVEDNKSEGE